MPADLVGAGYATYEPLWSALGRPTNKTNPAIAARSNAYYLGFSNTAEYTLVTAKQVIAAVPVVWGDIISTIEVPFASASGASAVSFAALYVGAEKGKAAKLITQSTAVTAELKAKTNASFTLKESVLITPENSPNGYIYASVQSEETTPGKPVSFKASAKGISYAATAPIFGQITIAQKAAKEAAAEVTLGEESSTEVVAFILR